jgi:phosphatidylserine/phosphatidylglycerophosphate/cardiolipin synthase-like enzyme
MKKITFFVFILLFTCNIVRAKEQVCFSPEYETCCQSNIINLIQSSKKTIQIAMYSFTDMKIAQELVKANARGVYVHIVTDKIQAKNKFSVISFLQKAGIPIKYNTFKIEHNKFAVFDAQHVITGSYNWTTAALKFNSENCLILDSSNIVNAYAKRFVILWEIYRN